jgi:hypothetical protein
MAYKSVEMRRGCGWREVGGLYAVSPKGTVGGTITTSCDFVVLQERIPVPNDAPDPGRGFAYVNGRAILESKSGGEWKVTPDWAEAKRIFWLRWGMMRERFNSGVCQGAQNVSDVEDILDNLEWAEGSIEAWPRQTQILITVVDRLRDQYGDCPLVPAIVESRKLRWLGPIHDRPADTLAALWRLGTEISWVCPIPQTVLDTASEIMEAVGAGEDVPLLELLCHKEEEHGSEEPDV